VKFKLTYILIFALIVSCKQNNLDVATDFKSKRISEYYEYEYLEPSEENSINENWVKEDSLFLSELKDILKKDEKDFLKIFKINEKDSRTKLGFGYEQIESSMGKGYVSIFYNLILKDGQVVSYEFTPQLPKNKYLTDRYIEFYSGIFKIKDNTIHNRYFNIEEMEKPIKNLDTNIALNENLKFLMTPFSGIFYRFKAKAFGEKVNRYIFNSERDNITPEICQILMESKNPATRIMAIEYYMENKFEFKNIDSINNWIEKVYLEQPRTIIADGCSLIGKNSKELVSEYINKKN
jgi:hypothetical protein